MNANRTASHGPRHQAVPARTRADDATTNPAGLPDYGSGAGPFCLSDCALIARPSAWSRQLEKLGVRSFTRPERLYSALRSRDFLPDACIVDLDAVPRNLVKAIDLRVPCPKLWIGKTAANPDDIKTPGIYYARARPEELNAVVSRLLETDDSTLLPAGLAGNKVLPLLVADAEYRERLHRYVDEFGRSNCATIHGDDALELHLVAQYMALESQRPRVWEVKTAASIDAVLRKIAEAKRPGGDVAIVLSNDIDAESARELYAAMPVEYSLIRLAPRGAPGTGSLSFTLPPTAERHADIETWIMWFVCRATIDHGVALAGLDDVTTSVARALGDAPALEDIKTGCERAVRQHATLTEDRGDFRSYEDLVCNYERTVLRQALTRHDWNLSATAKSLGLAESSLRYKVNKLGVSKNEASG